jgi:hypothetical protein
VFYHTGWMGWAGAVAALREDLGLSSRIHLMGRAVRLCPMLVVCIPFMFGFVLTPLPYQLGRRWAAARRREPAAVIRATWARRADMLLESVTLILTYRPAADSPDTSSQHPASLSPPSFSQHHQPSMWNKLPRRWVFEQDWNFDPHGFHTL